MFSGTEALRMRKFPPSSSRDLRELFNQRLTVRHIAEFDLKCAFSEEDGLSLRKLMSELDFDIMPVREGDRVHGYLVREELKSGPCGRQAHPLDSDCLIAESTPLLEVFNLLRDETWRFVLDRSEVAAIVTRGDLRKAPVRMFLFALINLFEMQLGRLIRHYKPREEWKADLSHGRLDKANELWQWRRQRNEALSLIDCLQFCDKKEIALATAPILDVLGFGTKNNARVFLDGTEALRDRIAHAQDLIEGISWQKLFDLAEHLETAVVHCERVSLGTDGGNPKGRADSQ
jgi:hypothetical protein